LGKTSALRFENVKFFKKPALYALKTLNFKLTLPSLGGGEGPPPLVEVNQAILAWSFLNQYPQCDESITLKLEYTVYIVFRNPHDPGKGSI
jgi:hypothetical protein